MIAGKAKWLSLCLAAVALVLVLVAVNERVGSARTVPTDSLSAKVTSIPQPTATVAPQPTVVPQPTAAKTFLKKAPATKPVAAELPKLLVVPSIGVRAGFEYVGLAADGAMDVPKDASKVAWYQLGPRPGEQGNAVVAGHVDWAGKAAVFWGLRNVRAGDPIQVTAMDDRYYDFSVQWVKWFPASGTSAAEEVFGQSDERELTLITCGGEFDSSSRQYLSRLVVRAVSR